MTAPDTDLIARREARSSTAAEIDRISYLLFETWKRVDPKSGVAKHPVSYMANFADMARAIIADRTALESEERCWHRYFGTIQCEKSQGHSGPCSINPVRSEMEQQYWNATSHLDTHPSGGERAMALEEQPQ